MDFLCAEQPEAAACIPSHYSALIIDHDPDQTLVLRRRLEQQRFNVITAPSGQLGLAAAHQDRPHLVLLDLRLPDMNGLSVCRRITESAPTCGIPVIVLTAMEGPHILREARQAGCHYFVRKPYDPNALLVLMQTAIRDIWETVS